MNKIKTLTKNLKRIIKLFIKFLLMYFYAAQRDLKQKYNE